MYFMTASATTTDTKRAPNPRFPERHTPSAPKAKQTAEEKRPRAAPEETKKKKKKKNPGERVCKQANAALVSVGNEEDSGREQNAFDIEFAVHVCVRPSGEFNSVECEG
jgi:hypothetical protein